MILEVGFYVGDREEKMSGKRLVICKLFCYASQARLNKA
jgi:hypothetical protein